MAFGDLSTERQIGMGLGPIPRSAILNYATEHGLLGDEIYRFEDIIRSIDSEYLSMINTVKDKDEAALVRADDIEGMKGVVARMKARAATATKKHVK
jgi:hypothetical protein